MVLSRSPSPDAELDPLALRALDFFHHSTVLQLARPFLRDLWSRMLTSLMYHESAIKHGIVSLASLHENFVYATRTTFDDQRRTTALEHYSKSIQDVVRLNRKDTNEAVMTTLVSCLLFCAIESIQGHFVSAGKHITAGINLLFEHEADLLQRERSARGVPTGFTNALRQLFMGLATQVIGFEESMIDPALTRYLEAADEVANYSFDTLDEALADVAHLGNYSLRFMTWAESCQDDPDFPNEALQIAGDKFQKHYDSWTLAYRNLLVKCSAENTPMNDSTSLALLILRFNHIVTRIILGMRFAKGDQTSFDPFVEDFRALVDTAEDLLSTESRIQSSEGEPETTFGMSLGILPGTFFACIRCRDYEIRHRALRILKSSRRRESIWDSRVLSGVAERLIGIEEKNARTMLGDQIMSYSTQDMPESVRVRELTIDFHGTENCADVSITEVRKKHKHVDRFIWEEWQ